MVNRLNRLDFGNVGLAVLAGAAVSMGFIQLLAGPLEQVANVSVQVLSIRTTSLVAPVVISLLLLLRDGPLMIKLGPGSPAGAPVGCSGSGGSRPLG